MLALIGVLNSPLRTSPFVVLLFFCLPEASSYRLSWTNSRFAFEAQSAVSLLNSGKAKKLRRANILSKATRILDARRLANPSLRSLRVGKKIDKLRLVEFFIHCVSNGISSRFSVYLINRSRLYYFRNDDIQECVLMICTALP